MADAVHVIGARMWSGQDVGRVVKVDRNVEPNACSISSARCLHSGLWECSAISAIQSWVTGV